MIALFVLGVAATVISRVSETNTRAGRVPAARRTYLQDCDGQWFWPEMRSACVRRNFNERMGFRTAPGGRLDALSQIVTRSRLFRIGILSAVAVPPAKP